MTLRIRAKARRDLDDILDYSVAAHGEVAGETYLLAIDTALDRLRVHPELGMARPDFGDRIRSLPVREHRLFYRFDGKNISVVRVLHKAMDPARHF